MNLSICVRAFAIAEVAMILVLAGPASAGCKIIDSGNSDNDLEKGAMNAEMKLEGNADSHDHYVVTNDCVMVAAQHSNLQGYVQALSGDGQQHEFGSKLRDQVSSFACICPKK